MASLALASGWREGQPLESDSSWVPDGHREPPRSTGTFSGRGPCLVPNAWASELLVPGFLTELLAHHPPVRPSCPSVALLPLSFGLSVTQSLRCLCTRLIRLPALAPTLSSSISVSVTLCGGVRATERGQAGRSRHVPALPGGPEHGHSACRLPGWPWAGRRSLVWGGPERTGQWQRLEACHLEALFSAHLLLLTWPAPCFRRPWPQAKLRWPVVLLGPPPWDPRQHAGVWRRPRRLCGSQRGRATCFCMRRFCLPGAPKGKTSTPSSP